jgi:hypothetical protein
MERDKFFSTSLLLKDLKENEKCVFMVCSRGRRKNGRGFVLKLNEGLAGPSNTDCRRGSTYPVQMKDFSIEQLA